MKKLMIILLVGMLSIGLSGVVYAVAGEQIIKAKINTSVSITTDPATLDGTAGITASGDWTDTSKTIVIGANCPYNVMVKFTGSAYPDGETTPDVYMTATTDPYTDLGEAFALGYTAGATSTDATMSENTPITSSNVTFVSCPTDIDDGEDTLQIKYTQTITMSDPSYHTTGTQLEYQIKLTWTASVDVG